MAKYILVKKVKGQKFEYQVIDTESKAIVSKRTSARDYVACTTAGISDSARRTMLGEGWTVDIIAHIFRYIKNTPGNP